jgi:hypothetical protein
VREGVTAHQHGGLPSGTTRDALRPGPEMGPGPSRTFRRRRQARVTRSFDIEAISVLCDAAMLDARVLASLF